MKAFLVNYNYSPDWLRESDLDYFLSDRSDSKEWLKDFPQDKITYTENIGDVDYEKLGYLIDNYDNLPDVFLWGKSNIHKYVDNETLQKAIQKEEFAPLLKSTHRIYSDHFGQVNKYQSNIYCERADSWFFNVTTPRYFTTWQEWCVHFGLPQTQFIPFAPGGNYILTRGRVHRYSRDFYADMRSMLPHAQRPAEAQAAERSYYLMFK